MYGQAKLKVKPYIVILGSILLIGSCIGYIKYRNHKRILSKFDSPDLPGSGRCMDRKLIKLLKKLEKVTGYPVFEQITSGARTPIHNKKVGGVSNSAHLIPKCKAVDIKTPTKTIRNTLVVAAKAIGFKRIGVGSTFIHLDIDESKLQNIAWGYPAGSKPPINPFV